MTVKQYQMVYDITNAPDIDDVDKSAWMVCYILGYETETVNNMKPAKFLKKLDKAYGIMNKAAIPLRWHRLNTDATKITLGQFIEILHWLKGGSIEGLHLIAASIIGGDGHQARAQKILNSNIRYVLFDTMEFVKNLNQLIKSYRGLFEIEEPDPEAKPKKPHPFIEQYGWIYSATQVAAFEGIALDKAYELPIMQALNDLSFLKAKQSYDKWQQK